MILKILSVIFVAKKWKKCLLRQLNFEDVGSLWDHYQNYHNVDGQTFLKEIISNADK